MIEKELGESFSQFCKENNIQEAWMHVTARKCKSAMVGGKRHTEKDITTLLSRPDIQNT